jgi:hypothetical protein
MAEFGGALDRWLEAPYVDAERRGAEYETWCEEHDLDPAGDHWPEFDASLDVYDPEPPDDEEGCP